LAVGHGKPTGEAANTTAICDYCRFEEDALWQDVESRFNKMPGRKKKRKTFRAVTAVKEMARERVGAPPAGKIVLEKKKKPEKHKPTLGKLLQNEDV
jgi:hypothetical protein